MISIEGNIGSGKSTIIEKCKNFLEKKPILNILINLVELSF